MQLLRLPSVKTETGYKADASIDNATRDGLFTRAVAIGQRSRAWPLHEIHAINEARIAGKSDAEIRELVVALHAKRTDPANVLAIV